jgi:pimeloyl-ACP methyl ester carboxylesterase
MQKQGLNENAGESDDDGRGTDGCGFEHDVEDRADADHQRRRRGVRLPSARPEHGVPVVFLTHLAAVLDNWDPRVVDGIAAKHRVITFDNRGVGASSGATPTTIEEMASDAVTFIRALGFDQVDLFGFSMGGMIAQVIAQQQPQLVRKMILAGTGPAGGEGIDKVTRITYLDTARGLLTRQDPKQFSSSPGPRTGAAPARSSWHGSRNVRTTATRPSPCARSAPSSRPSTDGVSRSPPTSRASTSRCSS